MSTTKECTRCGWTQCSLCRSGRTCLDTYNRARSRTGLWTQTHTSQAPTENTSLLNESVSTMLQYLQQCTAKCEQYHKSDGNYSNQHYLRYHTSNFRPINVHKDNIYSRSCEVHVTTPPGSYSVATRNHASSEGSRHTVKLGHGQSVSLSLHL